ncbi:hypothetical protein GOV08_05630 [Candidatus Woesearchaeota archaeon]|nr:hypothetical protein [Candidatus Woesearchaeota archaeon]
MRNIILSALEQDLEITKRGFIKIGALATASAILGCGGQEPELEAILDQPPVTPAFYGVEYEVHFSKSIVPHPEHTQAELFYGNIFKPKQIIYPLFGNPDYFIYTFNQDDYSSVMLSVKFTDFATGKQDNTYYYRIDIFNL